ncbi:MAG TPA: DUF6069 family protein [Roseiflexaceae bacterium]|nr:DUF6069 family protein [Roseiflexaceae bacterium]
MASGNVAARPLAGRVSLGQVLRVGGLAIVASVVVNLLLLLVLRALIPTPAVFPPFDFFTVALFTAVGVAAGVVVYAVLSRFVAEPGRLFVIIGVIALILSCIPNVMTGLDPSSTPFPDAPGAAFWALGLLHVPPAFVCIWLLATKVK